MRVALAADHAGVALKHSLKQALETLECEAVDFGTASNDSVDYPDYAERAARAVASGECERGILVCGTGFGMAIAANKISGIRAVPAGDPEAARLSRAHNDANVLTLGARRLATDEAIRIVRAFLSIGFDGGRHQRRVDKIAALERG